MALRVVFNGPKPADVAIKLLGTARETMKPGDVFQKYVQKNTLGTKVYLALGHNGRMLSLNLKNGEVAFSTKPQGRVKVIGSGSINANLGREVDMTRANLAVGDVFKLKGGKKRFFNLGRLSDGRYISVNESGTDYAIGRNSAKAVTKVGVWSVSAYIH